MLAREFHLTGQCRISWSNLRIVPEKFQDRDVPVGGRRPVTFSQHPCRVRVFETVHDVSEIIVILREKVWPLVIAATRSSSVRHGFEQISVRVVLIDSKAARRIISAGGAA